MHYYLGVDLGGTNLKAGIIDNFGNIISRYNIPTMPELEPEILLNRISDFIHNILSEYTNISAVGIGVPGVVSRQGIVKIAPHLNKWENIDLRKYLENRFKIPIAIDNDANAAAAAELMFGAGKGLEYFLYCTLGTGIGGGIVIDGKIYTGEYGAAGEIGHIILDYKMSPIFDKPAFRTAILEEYIGRNRILDAAKEMARNSTQSLLNEIDDFDVIDISNAAQKGDQTALRVFEYYGYLLGLALTNTLNILDINTVIFGGGISLSHDSLLNSALDTIKLRALPSIASRVKFKSAHYSSDAGIVGAGSIAKILINK